MSPGGQRPGEGRPQVLGMAMGRASYTGLGGLLPVALEEPGRLAGTGWRAGAFLLGIPLLPAVPVASAPCKPLSPSGCSKAEMGQCRAGTWEGRHQREL